MWQFTLPNIRLLSPNRVIHWRQLQALKTKLHRKILAQYNSDAPDLPLPATITITRIAPRKLDDDNMIAASKQLRDILADLVIPSLAPGQADSSTLLTWHYCQERGKPKEYSLKITIQGTHG